MTELGLFIPPVAPPRSFIDWLRDMYGGWVRVAWSRSAHRYKVVTRNRVTGEWVDLVIVQTPQGDFLPCDNRARELVLSRIVPSERKAERERVLAEIEARKQDKQSRDEREYVAHVVRDNRHQLFDIAPASKPSSAKKLVWSSAKK